MTTQTQALAGTALSPLDALTTHFSLSVLTTTKGNASKHLLVGANGAPVKGHGSLAITAGVLEHVEVAGLTGLKTLLEGIRPNQALVHGIVKGSQPGEVRPLVTTEALKQARAGTLESGTVARSLEYIAYPDDLFLLMFDRDDNVEDPTKLSTATDLLSVLAPIVPGLQEAGAVVTRSTSSAIRAKTTGEWLTPPTGSHTYFLARGDLQRFADLLTVRLWNAGYGYCKLASPNRQTGVASVLERALVDLSVFSPERLDYVAGARIAKNAPFYQDRGAPELREGTVLDLDALPEVTPEERQDYTARVAAAKTPLAPERFRLVKAAVATQDPLLPEDQVETIALERLERQEGGYLPEDFLLYFFHRKKAVAVKDLSADYDGLRLADPAEPDYREGTDAIFHWRQGDWLINSFAHGMLHTYRAVPMPPPDPDEEDMQDLLQRAEREAQRQRNGQAPLSETWRKGLLTNKIEEPYETLGNIMLALQHLEPWQTQCWYDEVRDICMVGERPLTDSLVTQAKLDLERTFRLPMRSRHLVPGALTYLCHQHPRDLLREWLDALEPWDRTPRLTSWFHDCAQAPKNAYGMDVSRLLIVSLVARALDPGCQYRYVVILEGPEDAGKSRLVEELGSPAWYREISHGLEGKESHMRVRRAWIAELAELASFSKTEDARLKAFFTLKDDTYIPKFANFEVCHKRRTIFIGTHNPRGRQHVFSRPNGKYALPSHSSERYSDC